MSVYIVTIRECRDFDLSVTAANVDEAARLAMDRWAEQLDAEPDRTNPEVWNIEKQEHALP